MKFFTRMSMVSIGITFLSMPTVAVIAEEQAAKSATAARTILAEDDKFQVFEIRQKPGEVNTPSTAGTRVIRALKGGSLLRTYPDGSTEKSNWDTGEVQIQGPGPQYTVKNIGDSEVVLYVVRLK